MIDWTTVEAEVTNHLQQLLRIDTTNPPGNEIEAAKYVSQVLNHDGFETEIVESQPGRGNVSTRLQGGDHPPLLLLGHLDVVACEPDKWTFPPFSGALHGGFVWGRGALDMKNMVATELMVMLLLKRGGIKLDRDVLFAATADEEAGKGDHGPGWLLDNRPELIDAPFVLTEGGGSDLRIGERRFYTCQTGQKGICRMRIHAGGNPGHGSIPRHQNAVLRLCKSIGQLDGVDLPLHPSATMANFLQEVAVGQEEQMATNLRDLINPERSANALAQLPLSNEFKAELSALLRNTASVTMLNAGSKINVIPATATAWVDGRLTPGQTKNDFLSELRPYIGEDVDIEVDQYSPSLEASSDSQLFRTIVEVMAKHDPEAPVVPSLMAGGTAAKHICPRRPDTQVYGFMPYRQQPGLEEMRLVHGHNERTSVENLVWATRIIYDIVCRFGSA